VLAWRQQRRSVRVLAAKRWKSPRYALRMRGGEYWDKSDDDASRAPTTATRIAQPAPAVKREAEEDWGKERWR